MVGKGQTDHSKMWCFMKTAESLYWWLFRVFANVLFWAKISIGDGKKQAFHTYGSLVVSVCADGYEQSPVLPLSSKPHKSARLSFLLRNAVIWRYILCSDDWLVVWPLFPETTIEWAVDGFYTVTVKNTYLWVMCLFLRKD